MKVVTDGPWQAHISTGCSDVGYITCCMRMGDQKVVVQVSLQPLQYHKAMVLD